MKKIFKTCSCLFILLTLLMNIACAKSLEEKKQEIEDKVEVALIDLYSKEPHAKPFIDRSYGYAVFVSSGYKLGFFGSAHGRGMAVNNETDEKTYMRMGEYSAGIGLGAKEYNVIFVFATEKAFNDFIESGWKFNGEVEAVATDNVSGNQVGGALNIGRDVWMYQITTKGLSAEFGLKGTEYYRDKSFYPEIYDKK